MLPLTLFFITAINIVSVVAKNGYTVKDSLFFYRGVSIAKIINCYSQIFPLIDFLIKPV